MKEGDTIYQVLIKGLDTDKKSFIREGIVIPQTITRNFQVKTSDGLEGCIHEWSQNKMIAVQAAIERIMSKASCEIEDLLEDLGLKL